MLIVDYDKIDFYTLLISIVSWIISISIVMYNKIELTLLVAFLIFISPIIYTLVGVLIFLIAIWIILTFWS